MSSELFDALDMLEEQKGIPKEYMLGKIEAALQSAYRKEQGPNALVRVAFNTEKKEVKMYRQYAVVENVENPDAEVTTEQMKAMHKRGKLGDVIEIELNPKNFRRLSAQTAKQVIIQGIREAERTNQIMEYEKKREEIIVATVQRIDEETGNLIVDTGTSTARILKTELIPADRFRVGDRLKACLTEVHRDSTSGPLITLSRTHPEFIRRLMEVEIPEIADGTVEIMSIAREAGSRTKVAVRSNDPHVDAVGACIGTRSLRINSILNEIAGEKIDLINYSDDPLQFIGASLAPATVKKVVMLETPADSKDTWKGTARAVVDEDQLSLAIGAAGQNARLAAKLTGYRVDIKTKEA